VDVQSSAVSKTWCQRLGNELAALGMRGDKMTVKDLAASIEKLDDDRARGYYRSEHSDDRTYEIGRFPVRLEPKMVRDESGMVVEPDEW
jgi:hypothetical protein